MTPLTSTQVRALLAERELTGKSQYASCTGPRRRQCPQCGNREMCQGAYVRVVRKTRERPKRVVLVYACAACGEAGETVAYEAPVVYATEGGRR